MLHKISESGVWFEPKRYGYGCGLPIAWQGWLLLASYMGAVSGIGLLAAGGTAGAQAAAFVLFVIATSALLMISARRTRGGWKWRWGEKE